MARTEIAAQSYDKAVQSLKAIGTTRTRGGVGASHHRAAPRRGPLRGRRVTTYVQGEKEKSSTDTSMLRALAAQAPSQEHGGRGRPARARGRAGEAERRYSDAPAVPPRRPVRRRTSEARARRRYDPGRSACRGARRAESVLPGAIRGGAGLWEEALVNLPESAERVGATVEGIVASAPRRPRPGPCASSRAGGPDPAKAAGRRKRRTTTPRCPWTSRSSRSTRRRARRRRPAGRRTLGERPQRPSDHRDRQPGRGPGPSAPPRCASGSRRRRPATPTSPRGWRPSEPAHPVAGNGTPPRPICARPARSPKHGRRRSAEKKLADARRSGSERCGRYGTDRHRSANARQAKALEAERDKKPQSAAVTPSPARPPRCWA